MKAAEEEDLEQAKALLDKGTDPNRGSNLTSPMYAAAMNCDKKMLELLLDRDVDRRGIDAELSLRTAATSCSGEVVELLLDKGADPNANYYLGGKASFSVGEPGKSHLT